MIYAGLAIIWIVRVKTGLNAAPGVAIRWNETRIKGSEWLADGLIW